MRKLINKKTYDTSTAKHLGTKYVGEYGRTDGYEEQLFITKNKEHFVYGVGGPDSKYPNPKGGITLLADNEAEEWKTENKDCLNPAEGKETKEAKKGKK